MHGVGAMRVTVDAERPRPLLSFPGPAELRELWEWRGLFLIFVWRDLSARYARSLVGLAWVVLQPISTMAVFSVVFGRIARIMPDGTSYRLFALMGITLWIFVRGAPTASIGSIVSQNSMVTRIYFPRALAPLSAVAGRLADFGLGLLVVLVVLAVSGFPPHAGTLLLVPVLAVAIVLVSGISLASSAINVRFREAGAAIPMVMQLWMYLSPVIYPASLVPARWRALYDLNPAVGILESFRASLLGRAIDWRSLGFSAAASLVIFILGFSVFRRMEDEFADSI